MNITALLLRRSAGRALFPVLAALVLGNTLLRSMSWRYEWMWAAYQYNFTVMLLGPLFAGIASWEGYRLSRSHAFLLSHQRTARMLAAAWAALFAWCAAAFVLGLAVVYAIVAAAGTPGLPGGREALTAVPALAFLGVEGALGLVAGWASRSRLAAPLTAIVVFTGSIWLYTSDFAPFVVVGGASGSLIGLQPRIGTQVAQIVCYTLVTLTVLALGSWAATSRRSPHTAAVVALSFLVAGSAVHLAARPPLMLEARTGDVVCTGEAPRICLGRSYTRFGPGLRSRITPYTEALESIGIEPPSQFRQDAVHASDGVVPVDLGDVTSGDDRLLGSVLGAYYDDRCEMRPGSDFQRAFDNSVYWLAEAAGSATYVGSEGVAPAIVRGTPDQKAGAARRAFAELADCRG
ncbi:hypothetical protein [Streptomyces sp. NRRL B-1381]|uniref:hypothetical protein n=1 Tax=Streptomyces sp. NRRL B-1381 TaxID=1463829 RepID=UPI0004C08095|nr:hypothetical protein [Streptomyces sp. NRRL B-1381]